MYSNRKNIAILFFTMVVVMLGFGMVIPTMPFYIKSFGASGKALGSLMATYGIMQFIFAPLWGSLSDRIGRKPVLLVGVLGNAIAQVLFGLSTQLWMLFAARSLSGILSSATLPTAMAFVGDNTTKEDRGGGMGMIGAAMGLGMVFGPAIGGLLAKQSLSTPFFIAAALSMLAFLLILAFLPETARSMSLQQAKSKTMDFKALWEAITSPIGILFFMSFLLTFGMTNFEGIFGLYAVDKYDYDSSQIGVVLAVIGLISALAQGGLTGPLTRRFGEVQVIRFSLFFTAIGFWLMSQANSSWEIFLSVSFFMSSNAMLNPSIASLISKNSSGGQGMTMGLNNSFLSLGRIAGPLWAGFFFDIGFNLPYFTGAIVMLIGFVISLVRLGDFSKEIEASPA